MYQSVNEKNRKILASLIRFVYLQLNLAILSSLICATIIIIGLFDQKKR